MRMDNNSPYQSTRNHTAGVIFHEDPLHHSHYRHHMSYMERTLIKYSGGLIKNPTQANYALIIATLVCFFVSFFLFWGAFSKSGSQKVEIVAPPDTVVVNHVGVPPHIQK